MSKRTVLSALALLTIGSTAALSLADVVLHPNTFHGGVRFINVDPAVDSLLTQYGMTQAEVWAESTAPTGYSSTTDASIVTPTEGTYQLSAESEAAGPSGITYTLSATATLYSNPPYQAWGEYYFAPSPGHLLQPVPQQPTGAVADIEECVGLVHIRWGADPACATPFVVNKAEIATSSSQSRALATSDHYVVVRGGTLEQANLYSTAGNDPASNTITIKTTLDLAVGCDEIQEVCVPMPDGAAGVLGALTGPFDILGETEELTTNISAYGPDGNSRIQDLSPPVRPEASPADWWILPHLVPGDWMGFAQATTRTGRRTNTYRTPKLCEVCGTGPMVVEAGQTLDLLRVIDGQPRYPFVMTPGMFVGQILLADPFVVGVPGSQSMLGHLWFGTDAPFHEPAHVRTRLEAKGPALEGGWAKTSFPGAFDPAAGALASDYELLMVNPYEATLPWRQSFLGLAFYNPEHGKDEGEIRIVRDDSQYPIGPGDVVRIDHRYCMSEVVLTYTTASGELFRPTAAVTGGFTGVDWQHQSTSYTVSGTMKGAPFVQADAAPSGQVRLVLPEGQYQIQPGAGILTAAGGISTASFAETDVRVGCGQRLSCAPGLCLSAELPTCADSPTPELTGAIASSGAPVDRIWYTVNGGPEIALCPSDCGADPSFAAPVSVTGCANTIEVFATSGGQTVSTIVQTTWEAPDDGVICEGSCEPTPPTSACATVKAEALSCSSGAGEYAVELSLTNESGTPITQVLMPDAQVSPHVVTFPSPLQPGASATFAVTLTGMHQGAMFCFDVGTIDEASQECCSTELCVEVPGCCFSTGEERMSCWSDGAFQYEMDLTNRTTSSIEHVFVSPPPGVVASPEYMDIPSTPPGGSAHVGPIVFSGVAPGEEVCFTIGIHDHEMRECCTEEVCVTAPEPCEDRVEPSAEAPSCAAAPPGGRWRGPGALSSLALACALGLARVRRRRDRHSPSRRDPR